MIRFPDSRLPTTLAFAGTTLADWLPAGHVHAALTLAALAHADKPALTFLTSGDTDAPQHQYSYGEFLEGVTRTANLLRALGVQRGDVVGYLLPSLPETQFVLWGAETAGIAFPINPLLQAADIAALARAAGVKVLVALGPTPGVDIWEKALQVLAQAPGITTLVKLGGPAASPAGAGTANIVDFANAFSQSGTRLTFANLPGRHDVAAYFHTGGTTGMPRLVIHTHENQLAAAYGGAFAVGAGPADTLVNGLPMFHVGAAIFSSLSMLLAGAQVVILSPLGFRNPGIVNNFWAIVQRTRATLVGGVPTALAAVLATDAGAADLSTVRFSISGAALTPRATALRMEQATARPLREIYGMTESGGVICVDPVSRPRVLGSAGCAIAFCEVQARPQDATGVHGAVCPPGQTGVLVVKGPNVTPGYKDATQNPSLFTPDGWLVTGDLGQVDASGRVFVTGRVKDLIIRSGHNIDPAMIEDCLLRHPAVAQAAAVGMPDAYAGEVPVAYVSLKPGAVADEAALIAFAAAHISERPALPRQILVLDTLPVTAVGKVFKPALRRDCAQRHLRWLLRHEPVASLEVTDDARHANVVTIELAIGCTAPRDAQARIEHALQGYLFSLRWRGIPSDQYITPHAAT